MKIIDSHIHYCNFHGFNEVAKRAGHENTPEHLSKVFKRNNIVMAVAMGSGMPTKSGVSLPMTVNLDGELDLCSYNQAPFISYCCGVDSKSLKPETMNETLDAFEKHFKTKRCIGLKFYPGYNHFYPGDPIHEPLYELAASYNLPVVFHTGDTANPDAILKYAHPLAVDEVAVKHRNINFIIAHCGNPWIVDAVEVAIKNPNVSVDLSGLAEGNFTPEFYFEKFSGYTEHLKTWLSYLCDYGKVLYGSDWPLVNIDTYLEIMKRIIPEQNHEDVFYCNAKRIFSRLNCLEI